MTNTDTKTITSMEDLKAVCGLCESEMEAAPLTIDGKEMVIMTKENFDNMEFELFHADLNKKLTVSEAQMINGDVIDGFEALARLSEEFGL